MIFCCYIGATLACDLQYKREITFEFLKILKVYIVADVIDILPALVRQIYDQSLSSNGYPVVHAVVLDITFCFFLPTFTCTTDESKPLPSLLLSQESC